MKRIRALFYAGLYILKNYLPGRGTKPFLASYKLTYRCNLNCRQCPFKCMGDDEPSFEMVKDTLERLYERGNRVIIFEGGEPMLWRDGEYTIHDVVKYARERFFCVGMTSNGTLPLDAATDILWVSIDGFEETHNRLRGGETFSRIIENIKRSSHPKLYTHITVNQVNHAEVPELINFLAPLVKGITIQFYYPYNHDYELFLDFEKRAQLLDEIIRLKKAGLPVMNSIPSLSALKHNTWRCNDWLIDNANPDGSISQGCYVKGRDDIDCEKCGFSPHTEISLAYQGRLRAILAGIDIFF